MRKRRTFLKERLGELKDSLEKSEVALNDYRRAKGIIPGLMSLDGKETVVLDRVSELSKDLTTAQVERIGLEAQMQLINSRKYDSMPAVMGDNGVQAVQAQLNTLDADIASMGKKFKPDYPPMMQMAAKREELERRPRSRDFAGHRGNPGLLPGRVGQREKAPGRDEQGAAAGARAQRRGG